MKNKHIALYLRVSSRTQDAASQEPDLARWAAGPGQAAPPLTAPRPIIEYRDTFTGTTMDRPGWGKLWAAVLAGEVEKIVVWRLDRLGRTAAGLTTLIADLGRLGVGLVSLRDGLDLSTPAGRLMAHVLASVAQYETEVRSERQLAGIAAARARGAPLGRPKGTGRPIKVTPEQVALVRRLAAEGTGKTAISRAVGLSRPTIYALLGAGPARG